MGKAPAFQFYAGDFLTDTAEWSNEEVGIYIRLLSYQWINKSIPQGMTPMGRLVSLSQDEMAEAWATLGHKFTITASGARYCNPKLEEIRQTQDAYREKQSEAGRRGAESRWHSDPIATASIEGNGNPNGDPIGNPNDDPYGQTMALRSSSSSSKDQDISVKKKSPITKNHDVQEVWKHFQETVCIRYGKNYRPTDAVKEKIRLRLKTYSVEELKQVNQAVADDDWDERYKNCEPMKIYRSDEKVDWWLNKEKTAPPPEKKPPRRPGWKPGDDD